MSAAEDIKTYRTSEIAEIIGIHPNTVRLYEELKLIPKPERLNNGYRVFTDFHIEQCRLIRIAFQVEVLQNGLRKKIVRVIKLSATGDFDAAISLVNEYLKQIRQEQINAENAIEIVKQILTDEPQPDTGFLNGRKCQRCLIFPRSRSETGKKTDCLPLKEKITAIEFIRTKISGG